MKIENRTASRIDIILEDGSVISFPPCDHPVRTVMGTVGKDTVDGVPIKWRQVKQIVNEPPIEEGTLYIVPTMVAIEMFRLGRNDILSPRPLKDESGRILGAMHLEGRCDNVSGGTICKTS